MGNVSRIRDVIWLVNLYPRVGYARASTGMTGGSIVPRLAGIHAMIRTSIATGPYGIRHLRWLADSHLAARGQTVARMLDIA
ncbi:hypothetical protein ACIBG0_02265 [Nocardia sp. NPDC050630]|uniref:hypothetical protein n=1 Tax=Nocardia sp. NPDC050630 TaxID=3364321 RepID=UPI0037BDA4DC